MTDEPWRATLDGVIVACRLTPKGGRDGIDGVARLADGTTVLLARVRHAGERAPNEALSPFWRRSSMRPLLGSRWLAAQKAG